MALHAGYIPIYAGIQSPERLQRILDQYASSLQRIGLKAYSPENYTPGDLVLFFILTGGTEELVLRECSALRKQGWHGNVLLLAHSGENSLPAALEVMARMQMDGFKGRIYYIRGPDDRDVFSALKNTVTDFEVFRKMQESVIGIIGAPSNWLVASTPDVRCVKETWGPSIKKIPMKTLMDAIKKVPRNDVNLEVDHIQRSMLQIIEPDQEKLVGAAAVFLALRHIAKTESLNALTLRCFDLLEHDMTGCYALSRLNDMGVIAACEGDLVSTVCMLWVHLLLGKMPWMANPSRIDPSANTLWLAHCTVPQCLSKNIVARSHFESGTGVAIQGELRHGPVTLIRIGGRDMRNIWIAEGDALPVKHSDDLCRTQMKVQLKTEPVMDLLRRPLGNHLIIVRGYRKKTLKLWWQLIISCKSENNEVITPQLSASINL